MAIITPFAPNTFNVLKFALYTLLIIPAAEFLLRKFLNGRHWRRVCQGKPIKLRASKLGLWSLHAIVDENSRVEQASLAFLALCFLCSMLALEFGFDSAAIATTAEQQVPARFGFEDMLQCSEDCLFTVRLQLNAKELFECAGRPRSSTGFCSVNRNLGATTTQNAVVQLAPKEQWEQGFVAGGDRQYVQTIRYGGLSATLGLYDSGSVVIFEMQQYEAALFHFDGYVWLSGTLFEDSRGETKTGNAHRLIKTEAESKDVLAVAAAAVASTIESETLQAIEELSVEQLERVSDLIVLMAIEKPFRKVDMYNNITFQGDIVETGTALRATIGVHPIVLTACYAVIAMLFLFTSNLRAPDLSIEGLHRRAVVGPSEEETTSLKVPAKPPLTGLIETRELGQYLGSTYVEDAIFVPYTAGKLAGTSTTTAGEDNYDPFSGGDADIHRV